MSTTATCTSAPSSRAADEPLPGTASHARVWVLLEDGQPWGKNAPDDAALPQPFRDALNAVPGVRLALIRQPGAPRPSEAPRACFVAVVDDIAPALYRVDVADDAALAALDVPGMAARAPHHDVARADGPLLGVCTNSAKDACCGAHGVPLYRALAAHDPAAIWQITHIGGHRFAPTLVAFPSGMCYGYVHLEEAATILRAERAGRPYLLKARGRTGYPEPAQAAEIALRQRSNIAAYTALRLVRLDAQPDGTQVITFTAVDQPITYTVTMAEQPAAHRVLKTSGMTTPEPVGAWRVLAAHQDQQPLPGLS